MNPSEKALLLLVPAALLMILGVFARTLGLSETSGLLMFVAALLLMFLGYRETIKAKETTTMPLLNERQWSHRFWVLVVTNLLTCTIFPFLLPYTGVNLPFEQRVMISAVSFLICLATSWFGTRGRKDMKASQNH